MSIEYDDISLTDSPIQALSQCFAECNLPHTLLSEHCVALEVNGDWQQYDVAFVHQEYCFTITAPLPLHISVAQQESMYGLIGRMNADVPFGHFLLNTERGCIDYCYSLPTSVLVALDIEAIEELIETAVTALETLYPVAETLLAGDANLEVALDKYLYPAQGRA